MPSKTLRLVQIYGTLLLNILQRSVCLFASNIIVHLFLLHYIAIDSSQFRVSPFNTRSTHLYTIYCSWCHAATIAEPRYPSFIYEFLSQLLYTLPLDPAASYGGDQANGLHHTVQ